ncbi:GNAT family N-acetyltransferase [Psychrobacter pulmonis]|uniref:GNAT family N-acetyltransferase n=1 Tax=Psychrobacter pulmonis TaxID=228654 RepID=UPI001919B2B3|nr:GNAT family N-acetyltransferase [Psychrobacter pulmonis]
MSEYKLIRVDSLSRDKFISTWEKAFDRKLDRAIYDWIFNDKNIIYALSDDDKITAGYCLYPFDCIYNKKREIALLCNNVFVHPDYQGKNLFVKIGKLALNDVASKGLGVIAYGIPNRLALPGHKRTGWDVRPRINFISANRKKNTEYESIFKRGSLTGAEKQAIELCSIKSSRNRNFSILKTKQFVNWRFEQKPNVDYWYGFEYDDSGDLNAYCVCKYFKDKRNLHFIDIDGIDSVAIKKLITRAHSVPEDFSRLDIWDSSVHKNSFLECGFQNEDVTDNLILINPATMEFTGTLDDINITLSDNDVY